MQTQSKVFIGITALILIVVGINMNNNNSDVESATQVAENNHSNSDVMNEKMEENEMTDEAEMVKESEDKMMDEEMTDHSDSMTGSMAEKELVEVTPDVQPLTAGTYTTYNEGSISESEAENIVLFFKASWCPSCRTLDKNIKANISDIPDGVEIYEVDYDSNIELRKKYGVTTQHTLVEITADGALVKKWSGGNRLTDVVSKL